MIHSDDTLCAEFWGSRRVACHGLRGRVPHRSHESGCGVKEVIGIGEGGLSDSERDLKVIVCCHVGDCRIARGEFDSGHSVLPELFDARKYTGIARREAYRT